MPPSVFSVEYEHPEHPDNYCSADWGHSRGGEWKLYWKNKYGSSWNKETRNNGKIDKLAYEAILKKFGLEEFRDRMPLELVRFTSPAVFMTFRAEAGLPIMHVFSDTPGNREARAEDYE